MKFSRYFYSSFVFLNVAVVHVCSQSEAEPKCVEDENSRIFNKWALKIQNRVRKSLNISDLDLDDNTVSNATEWSRELAKKGAIEYSDNSDSDYGEIIFSNPNLFLQDNSESDQLHAWYKENKDFIDAGLANISIDGAFIQVRAETTRGVGCGACSGSSGTFVTCRYYPKVDKEALRRAMNQGRSLKDSDTSESNSSDGETEHDAPGDEKNGKGKANSQPNNKNTNPGSKNTKTEGNDALGNANNGQNHRKNIPGSKTTQTKDNEGSANGKNNVKFTSPQPPKGSTASRLSKTTRSKNLVTSTSENDMFSKTVLFTAFLLTTGVLIFSISLVVILSVLLYNQTKKYYYCTLN